MRLLVECTYVYDNPHMNSGIQRVVRNIITKLNDTQHKTDAVPVIFKNNKIYEVKRLSPDSFSMYIGNRIQSKLVRGRRRYWLYYEKIEQIWPFNQNPKIYSSLASLCKIGDASILLLIYFISRLCQIGEIGKRIDKLSVRPGDVLVLLDSSWHSDLLEKARKLKTQGVSIVAVIYDLIPLTHPQFCDENLVAVFQRWFRWVGENADGFMAISMTIRDQVHAYVVQNRPETKSDQWFDYFHLGSELDLAEKNGEVREHVQKLFQNDAPIYLMVGTIEPRKNHGYLLDAFDILWQNDVNVSLCFVGKVGWKCQALMKRVEMHRELKRHLFMLEDLSDTELEYCYRKSRSLVFPASVEGFGLPLVEAMQRGLPVMASDIPVFREVGGDFISYFDLEKPETLAALILQYEKSGEFPSSRNIKEWSWLNWEDSAKQFLTRIVSHTIQSGVEMRSKSKSMSA